MHYTRDGGKDVHREKWKGERWREGEEETTYGVT